MGLMDDLSNEALLTSKYNQRCRMCQILDDVTVEEADKLRELLSNPTIGRSLLAKVLTSNGHDIKPNVLNRHARGDCAGK